MHVLIMNSIFRNARAVIKIHFILECYMIKEYLPDRPKEKVGSENADIKHIFYHPLHSRPSFQASIVSLQASPAALLLSLPSPSSSLFASSTA